MTKTALNQKGFTLIEVTVTTVLLIVAFLGLLSLSIMAMKGNDFSKTTTTATALVNEKIEILKSMPFTSADLSSGSHTDAGNPLQGLYNRTWTITNSVDATTAKILSKTITVTVSWSWQGRTYNVSFNTVQSNQGS